MDSYTHEQTTLSDHALLSWDVAIGPFVSPPRPPRLTAENAEEWMKRAKPNLQAAFELPATDSHLLDAKALAIQQAMATALESMARPQQHSKTEVPWWTSKCSDAIKAIKAATTARMRGQATRAFKATIRAAKRSFYSEQVAKANHTNIWKWAKCGLGIRPTPVPSFGL